MSLESTATYINSFNPVWPDGADQRSTADDHIRLIKGALLRTFPSITNAITVSDTLINNTKYLGSLSYTVGLQNIGSLSFSLLSSGLIDTTKFGYPQTAAELAASVTPVNLYQQYGYGYRFATNTTPGTTSMTTGLNNSLLQAYQATGVAPYWQEDTYVISSLIVTSSVKISTDTYGTKINQQSGLGDVQMFVLQSSNVTIEKFTANGNISTDSSEFHHVITTNAAIRNIRLDGINANNIRGDIINVAGTAGNPVYDFTCGPVYGTNIYRNGVSVTGCDGFDFESIECVGVGYRTWDMEPNASSQRVERGRIRRTRGASVQASGQNLAGGIGSLQLDDMELDNSLIANSTPGYPSYPGSSGNIGFICGDYDLIRIGNLKARGYLDRLMNSNANTRACRFVVEKCDISGCNTTETTFKCLFNLDAFVTLELRGGTIVLAAIDRAVVKGNAGRYIFRDMTISGGLIAQNGTGCDFSDCAIDLTSVTSFVFASIINSTFTNCTFTNAGSATLLFQSTGNIFINCSGTFGTVEGASCSGNRAINSTFNGIYYTNSLLSGGFLSKAMADANQTLSATESQAEMVRCTGALTAQRNLIIPVTVRRMSVDNSTTGGFGVQVIGTSGAGVVLANGKKADFSSDGTNIIQLTTAL